ncbi:FHA domain-containing protein [Micromonospora sp. NPDC003197]
MADEIGLSPLLTVVSGPLRGASFRLRSGLTMIGRGDEVDICIDDRRVSRRHATVKLLDGRVLLNDAASTNGTWLNDQRLSGVREVRDGDRIRIGGVELRFFDPGSATTDPVGALSYRLVAPRPPLDDEPVDGEPSVDGKAVQGGPSVNGKAVQRGPSMGGELVDGQTARALRAPTQAIATRPPRRLLLVLGGGVVLAGWVTWAYLIFQ